MTAEDEQEPAGPSGGLPQVDLRQSSGVQFGGSGLNLQVNNFGSDAAADIARDIRRLREVTGAALNENSDEVTIPAPEGAVTIQRDIAALAAGAEGSFALIGEPGAGKSVLAARIAGALLEAGEDVVFLGAESLAASLGATRAELGMHNNLDQVLTAWDGPGRGSLVIDGIDATRGTGSVDWLPGLARSLRSTRWRVAGTIRTFDLRHGRSWQQMFPGTPLAAGHADPAFGHVRHLLVSDLTEAELSQVRDASPGLAALVTAAEPRLAVLLRNPFNLRLAAELASEGAGLAGIRTRQELLHLYWERRVELVPDRLARRRALRELCDAMAGGRRARVNDPSTVVDTDVFGAVEGLLRDGVLREDSQGRRHAVSPVVFSHPVLFDFAVAVTCLRGEDTLYLKQRLDGDPDLAVTIRPSIDMYFADEWAAAADRVAFWELALALSSRGQGHPIAAMAAACTALQQRPGTRDFLQLKERVLAEAEPEQTARRCVANVAAAFDAKELSPADRQACAPALAGLAADLAASAAVTGDTGIADLASLLLYRIGRAFPMAPGAVAAETRSRAAADVMRCALLSPARAGSETLASRIAEPLAEAVAVAPGDTGAVIDAVIAPQVMAVWGGIVAMRLITHAGVIAAADADLAARLMLSVWQFEEQRDEKTPIGNSGIVGLTSTRKQDLGLARYQTGQSFPAFLAAAPDAAFRFLTSVISLHVRSYEPVRAGGQLPRVYQGQSLQYPGDRALLEMTRAVITFLITAAESDDAHERAIAAQLIRIAVAQVSHHQFWNLMLEAGAAHPGSLGLMLLPLLDGSDLLGHYTTMALGARLTAALSALLPPAGHAELEGMVLQARDPFNPAGERRQELTDMLLSQLDTGRVQDPGSRARLAELDAHGRRPAVPSPPGADGDYDGVTDAEWNRGDNSTAGPDGDALRQAAAQVAADSTNAVSQVTEVRDAARQQLRASVPRLNDALIERGRTPGAPAPDESAATLARGAQLLACDPDVLPGNALGQVVMQVLTDALPAEPPDGESS
jgi:hypothetical protein